MSVLAWLVLIVSGVYGAGAGLALVIGRAIALADSREHDACACPAPLSHPIGRVSSLTGGPL